MGRRRTPHRRPAAPAARRVSARRLVFRGSVGRRSTAQSHDHKVCDHGPSVFVRDSSVRSGRPGHGSQAHRVRPESLARGQRTPPWSSSSAPGPVSNVLCWAVRSAGRPPEQFLDTAALALGRTARAAITNCHRDGLPAWRRWRALVDIALGGHGRTDALDNDPGDDHDTLASLVAQPYLVTDPDRMRRLDPCPVDPDVAGPAGVGRVRTGLGQPHRPDPAVNPRARLLIRHPVTVIRYARAVVQPTARRPFPSAAAS
jgi:hypothetical protein